MVDEPGGRLEALVAPAFRLVKQYLRGRWAGRRPAQSCLAPPYDTRAPQRKTLEHGAFSGTIAESVAPDGEGWLPARRRRRARWRPAVPTSPVPGPRR